ncbi:Pyridine nucleotide-disulfide oxidoreductase, dimerization domain protein, partial [mine drainage metagenome]
PHASELISEISLAIESGLTVEDLGSTIHPHPTISEAVKESAEIAYDKPLHFKPNR